MSNYSQALNVVTINGRPIKAFGVSSTPVSDGPIDPKSTILRGNGGKGTRLDRISTGGMCTLALEPGSSDSAYVQGLYNSGATISYTRQQIGTLEVVSGTEGAIISTGKNDRGGATSISDDIYNLEFNVWTELKGGE